MFDEAVRKVTKEIWKNRTYPNPYNKDEQISFGSETDYIEFCLKALNKAGKTSWHLFANLLNPDFPQD